MPDLTLNINEHRKSYILNNDPAEQNEITSSGLAITGHWLSIFSSLGDNLRIWTVASPPKQIQMHFL